jgi:urease accessory protein
MTCNAHIVAARKFHKTYLKSCYCDHPFKVANITEDRSTDLLRLMITSTSPGVLDNDQYNIGIEIEEYAKMHLTTQGYQRLFTMKNKASQTMTVHAGNKTSFYYLPHPNVPHRASDFSSVNNLFLSDNHHVIWSEIITCGRKLNGEEFIFKKFHSVINIYLREKLVVKENVLLEPLKNNIRGIGQLEGYTHQSTVLFIDDKFDMVKLSELCNPILSAFEDIAYGISRLPVNGLIFRILGQQAEKLFMINNKLALLIQNFKEMPVDRGSSMGKMIVGEIHS